MDSLLILLIYSIAITVAALLGGILPLIRNWTSLQLHLFTAFSAGVFVGAAFLHMIPDAMEMAGANSALLFVLIGFIFILFAERVIMHSHARECVEGCEHDHMLTGFTAFFGLLIHSLVAGIGLGIAVLVEPTLGVIVFAAIMAHESIELFSLSTVFKLARFENKKIFAYLTPLSLTKPAGAWIAVLAFEIIAKIELGIPLALAAGTFLYVGICDLLPEAFHEEKKRYSGFILVLIGIAIMYALGLFI
ncbi:MAG: ZIP family metal transporter [Methanomassiliicoccales archaeon]|jgi:zinc transporter ZupT|nr:ZIP family metal transporter [Methanomassiliicoccales archaeon]